MTYKRNRLTDLYINERDLEDMRMWGRQAYAGIGARATPEEVLNEIVDIAFQLAEQGLVLRSGHADGADIAFEQGHGLVSESPKEIFLPWKLLGVMAEH